jgi:nicotinamidase-related amidase
MRLLLSALLALPLVGQTVTLNLRSRVEAFKGSGEWQEVSLRAAIEPNRTAAVLCDVWDNHWCRGAAGRVNLLAPRIDRFVEAARKRGVLIIHAPSDTMDFYKDAPQRLAILALPTAMPPAPLDLASPPLPIDDSDGGCDTPGDKTHKAWSRQHAAIRIAAGDLVSDKGVEVYNALQARGINHLLVLGVHTNMCILNRTFAIKQMTRWGVRAILVRDLTDAMYDPQDKPFVSHEQGTELVIQHIEKYWCPTVLSADLLQALNRR